MAKSTLVAALDGLLLGFDTAVIAGTTGALTQTCHLAPRFLGVTVSSAIWGTVLGAMLAGIPGKRFGRWDLDVTAIPAALFFFMLLTLSRSPVGW